MRRIIILIVVAIVAIIIVALIFSSQNKTEAPVTGELPAAVNSEPLISPTPPANAPKDDRIALNTVAGAVRVKNFYKNAKGTWPEMDAVVLEKEIDYTIWYYRGDSSFEIALSEGATLSAQYAGEKALLNDLGINQADTCELSAWVTFVSDKVSGERESVPLSFCGPAL